MIEQGTDGLSDLSNGVMAETACCAMFPEQGRVRWSPALKTGLKCPGLAWEVPTTEGWLSTEVIRSEVLGSVTGSGGRSLQSSCANSRHRPKCTCSFVLPYDLLTCSTAERCLMLFQEFR
jgi:hypothetical protein